MNNPTPSIRIRMYATLKQHTIFFNNDNLRLVHMIIFERDRRERFWTEEQRADYEAVVDFLARNGESLDDAQEDLDLWDSWKGDPIEKKERIKKVILARDARKAAIPKLKPANQPD